MSATYKIVDVNGKIHAVGKPTASSAFRSAKEWAQIMKLDMMIVNEQS